MLADTKKSKMDRERKLMLFVSATHPEIHADVGRVGKYAQYPCEDAEDGVKNNGDYDGCVDANYRRNLRVLVRFISNCDGVAYDNHSGLWCHSHC